MTTAQYLSHLTALRDQLAHNLNRCGVTASSDETLTTLIPKVLDISSGNPYLGYFVAEFTTKQFDLTYGVLLYNTPASFNGMLAIDGYFKMSSFTLTLSGSGLTALQITAPGATVTKASDNSATIKYTTPSSVTRHNLQDMLDAVVFQSNADAEFTITASSIEQDTGDNKVVEGSKSLKIQKNCWGVVQDTYPTWAVAGTMTWAQIEELIPPA